MSETVQTQESNVKSLTSISKAVTVEFDMKEFPTWMLMQELEKRSVSEVRNGSVAENLRAAFHARNARRFEALLGLLDPHYGETTP